MYKLIIFDLGGVVFTNGTKKFVDDISSRHEIDRDQVVNVLDGEEGSKYREGLINRDEFWTMVLANLPLTETVDELEKEWISNYHLIPGTDQIIKQLKEKYTVLYLSDNVKDRVDKLDAKFNFISWFKIISQTD